MTKIFVRTCIVLSLTLASASSLADLNSPTFKSAKEAYVKSDWANALKLLKQYANEDSIFLSANPTEKEAIAKAVSYCEGKTTTKTGLIAGGVKSVPAPQPTLP